MKATIGTGEYVTHSGTNVALLRILRSVISVRALQFFDLCAFTFFALASSFLVLYVAFST